MSAPPDAGAAMAALERAEVRATYEITVGQVTRQVQVARLGPGACGGAMRYAVRIDEGPVHQVETTRPVADVLSMLMEDDAWEAGLVSTEEGFDVEILGIRHEAQVVDPRRKALRLAEGTGAAVVKTAMPGRVVRTLVEVGDEVTKGQPVVVVEAMKMENELKAPRDGVVRRVAVSAGALVESGAVLVELG